jgi:hypothetical protein
MQPKSERMYHPQNRRKLRIPVPGQGLVQAFPTKPGCLRNLAHAFRPRDIAKGSSDDRGVAVLESGAQIPGDALRGVKVLDRIPLSSLEFIHMVRRASREARYHSTYPIGYAPSSSRLARLGVKAATQLGINHRMPVHSTLRHRSNVARSISSSA